MPFPRGATLAPALHQELEVIRNHRGEWGGLGAALRPAADMLNGDARTILNPEGYEGKVMRQRRGAGDEVTRQVGAYRPMIASQEPGHDLPGDGLPRHLQREVGHRPVGSGGKPEREPEGALALARAGANHVQQSWPQPADQREGKS